jgi:UDP-N-acetylmuramoyl-L-alanyl-D-glutamate--2,6-diaminopimelate ligase
MSGLDTVRAGGVPLEAIADRLRAQALLLEAVDGSTVVTGITDDSRAVRPGDLFCAWVGSSADAHAFVPAAAAAGAAAALVERRVPEAPVPQLVSRDGRRAAAAASALLHGDAGERLLLAGVTGTNGKTTTVWLLRHMLATRYSAASIGTLGTLGADGGPSFPGESLTTPGPVELPRTLAALERAGIDAVAMEVSSHALDQGRVHGLAFDVAVFTNLSRDHLDYHGTIEAYTEAKRSLVRQLRHDGTAVINADDPAWTGLWADAPRALTFSIEDSDADVHAAALELTPAGASFDLVAAGHVVPVQLPLVGAYNVENALAAAAVCSALGFELPEIAAGLATAPQVPGRLERISVAPCPVLRDYAHTPDALERVLEALKPLVDGRLVLLFGAGGDRDRGKRPLMGAVAERWADLAIVTSDNPRTEDPDRIIDDIESGMSAGRHTRIADRRAAIGHALAQARPDDVILLAGKGHEDYQIIGREKLPFDERTVVAELLGRAAREVEA